MPLRKSIIWSYSGIKMCSNLCSPKDCSMPGFPVFHYLPEFAQAHVHLVIDAIKPYHLLSFPFPPDLSLSQYQSAFQWVDSLHQVAKVLEIQLQYQSFKWIFRVDFPQDWLVWSPCCPRDSQKSFPTPQFESINSSAPSLCSNSWDVNLYVTTGKTIALTMWTLVGKVMSLLF